MIPLSLALKNFLSYGPTLQTIDFASHHLICLSGKNGHGKSALLDAITWVIWGQARKISDAVRADDGLLRLGQTNMVVIFDFECNGQRYRIKREYTRNKTKAFMHLDFAVMAENCQEFSSLTEKTVKSTQQCIEKTLGIDFESFVNSVFLRQSNANEFSRKSPKGRKEILATILGLDQYENLRKRALEKIRQTQTEAISLTTLLQTYTQEKNQLIESLKQKDLLNQKIANLEKQEALIKQLKETIIKVQQTKNQQQHEFETARTNLSHYMQEELVRKKELAQEVSLWRAAHKAQRQKSSISLWETQRQELLLALQNQQELLQKQLAAKEQLLEVKEAISKDDADHARTVADIMRQHERDLERMRIDYQTTQAMDKSTKQELSKIQQDLIKIDTEITQHEKSKPIACMNEQELIISEVTLEKRKCIYQQCIAQHNFLLTQNQETKQKIALTHNENDPCCPLCEQNLSASRRRFLKQKFTVTEQTITHKLKRLKRIIPRIKEMLLSQHSEINAARAAQKSLETWNNTFQNLQNKKQLLLATIQQVSQSIDDYAKKIENNVKEIELQENRIAEISKTAYAQRTELYHQLIIHARELTQVITSHNYDAAIHKLIQKQLHEIESLITENKKLTASFESQKERFIRVTILCKHLREFASLRKQAEKIIAQNCADQTQKIVYAYEKELEKETAIWLEQKKIIQQEYGKFEAQTTLLEQKQQECERIESALLQTKQIISDYQAIAHATGKDGIQALLIDDAIPEIEYEANLLLARLTDNQSQIFIESLKDLKKGGTKETLDIKIADTAGIRPYELFSGGEAFRIDFALRIAISKLLARRAGTTLQTLIIDEGFGSQDEEGLLHIMDVIHKIQDDFAKIIIVSHLTVLKDQFPIHFVVEKRPQGSMISIVEQG